MRIRMKEEVVRWAYMEVPDEELEDWEKFSHYANQAWLITAVACGCRATSHKCNRPLFTDIMGRNNIICKFIQLVINNKIRVNH